MKSKKIRLALISILALISASCGHSNKSIVNDFTIRVNYLETLILPRPYKHNRPNGELIYAWGGFGGRVEIKDEGYTDYEFEVIKTNSLTEPYKAELTFSKQDLIDPDKPFRAVKYYKFILSHSGEKGGHWRMKLMNEKEAKPEAEWKDSTELGWIVDAMNTSIKQINNDIKTFK